MNIYLDIDGTLLHEELTSRHGKPAVGLAEFLLALRAHEPYWLTSHCRDGDPTVAQARLKPQVPETLHADIDQIQGTTWSLMKTEAIDWTCREFIWLDDHIAEAERARFARVLPGQTFIEMNLRANPEQLIEIIADVL